ncbi:BtrH N-terminal domain-containing protein [Actinoplanes sp. NPDC051859]|uniref:BtrH N-terminal domain-containing protein n=1 Tax=Actinoplanes sp. NPDC051859 TaxID=3363909 RepID=UPI0037A178EA
MTEQKHLKARIRARMARTGERYAAARRHVVGDTAKPHTDNGWALRGGRHPETAAVSHVLADHGVELSEAMVLGIGGGLGAGYILWEFAAHDTTHLTLGFRRRWNYLDWTDQALDRLGARYRVHTTSGAKGAAAALHDALAAGERAIVVPDWYLVGYWQLPAHLEAHGGHAVVAYAATDAGVRIDDRNTRPLTVAADVLHRARARVVSYRNKLVVVEAATAPEQLADLVRAGVRECAEHLGGTSTSFALPAWQKWAKMLTDRRNAKGWPTVFADGRGLTTALFTVWEEVEPVGMSGGHLRDMYADFLDEAVPLLGERAAQAAEAFRAAGRCWHAFAEAALPADVPEYARLRALAAAVAEGVALGDDGAAGRAEAATELWQHRSELDRKPPVAPDLGILADRLRAVHAAETEAVQVLRAV